MTTTIATAGIRALESGDATTAKAQWDAGLDENPDDVQLLHCRALLFLQRGQIRDAILDADRCVHLAPLWYKAHVTLAMVLRAMGRSYDAVRCVCHAKYLYPHSSTASALEMELLKENPCLLDGPVTTYELLRFHVQLRMAGYASRRTYALRILYRLFPEMDKDRRVYKVVMDILRALGMTGEAINVFLRRDGDEEPEDIADDAEEGSVDVSFLPPRLVVCDAVQWTKPCNPWRVCVHPDDTENSVQYTRVKPYHAMVLKHAVLKGKLAAIVFRLPQDHVVHVDDGLWMGTVHTSCTLVVGLRIERIVDAVHALSHGTYGATWIWVHAEESHYMAALRELRAEQQRTLSVKRGCELHIFRHAFVWNVVHVVAG